MRRRPLVGLALAIAMVFALTPSSPAAALSKGSTASTAGQVALATPESTPDPAEDPVRAAQYWLDDYGITEAWKTTRGKGVRIAIIDTGIGRGPAEFAGAVVGGTDVSGAGSEDGRTPVGAVDANHGSWVASLAAARGTGPQAGMIGVAPEAELLSISVGFGSSATVSFVDQIADAVVWAVDNGADIINMSLTTNVPDWDESWDKAFLYAHEKDVVVIVAAGNRASGTTRVGAPATIPGVLTVGGVDPSGRASVGASTQGITIGVSAPSEKLLGVSANGQLVQWDGTSGAAPIVAGIAALVRAAHPDLDANNVINRIIETATPPAATSERNALLYGSGLVDAAAAVGASVPTVSANPMGSLSEWIRLYRRADSGPAPVPTTTPFEVEMLPPAEAAPPPVSLLLPTYASVLYGSLPLIVLTATAILVALGVTAAVRRIRSSSLRRAADIQE